MFVCLCASHSATARHSAVCLGKAGVELYALTCRVVNLEILFFCVYVYVLLFVYRGRSTHPGSIVHLSDNPVDVNRVSIILAFLDYLLPLFLLLFMPNTKYHGNILSGRSLNRSVECMSGVKISRLSTTFISETVQDRDIFTMEY